MGKEQQIRLIAHAVLRRVMLESGADGSRPTLATIDAAYPFGERQGLPYRIWRDEARRILGPAGSASAA